jgi:hypothetical protein
MLNPPDVRFKASGPETAQATRVLFPLRVRVNRPSAEQALVEAKRVVEQFRQAAERAELPAGRFGLADPALAAGTQAAELVIEHLSKREVRLQLLFLAALTWPPATDFWARASAIAGVTDFLQKFSQMSREKDIEVDPERAKLSTEAEGGPGAGGLRS